MDLTQRGDNVFLFIIEPRYNFSWVVQKNKKLEVFEPLIYAQ